MILLSVSTSPATAQGRRSRSPASEILKGLKSKDSETRIEAARLVFQKKIATRKIVSALKDNLDHLEKEVAIAAIRALGALGKKGRSARSKLLKLAEQTDETEIAWEASLSLVLIGDKSGLKTIKSRLLKASTAEKVNLAVGLGQKGVGGKGAEAVVSELFKDPEPQVRVAAAQSLYEFGASSAMLGDLRKLLKDMVPQVRYEAAKCLPNLGKHAAKAIPQMIKNLEAATIPQERAMYLWAFGRLGDVATSAVPAILKAAILDPQSSEYGTNALRKMGKRAVPHLVRGLEDTNSSVRVMSCRGLGFQGQFAGPALPKLKELAKNDPVKFVRDTAAWAIKVSAQPRLP